MRDGYERREYRGRDEWLQAREGWLGCSEVSALFDCGFMNREQLWEEKLGIKPRRDLSDNEYVQKGIRMEPLVRTIYEWDHPENRVYYHGTDVLWKTGNEFLRGTLDGEVFVPDAGMEKGDEEQLLRMWVKTHGHRVQELRNREKRERYLELAARDGAIPGRWGVLEIKTTNMVSSIAWEKWKDQIPKAYYIQILSQMSCTGYDFVDLEARLYRMNGDSEIRTYHFERSDVEEEIRMVEDKARDFWENYVLTERRPAPELPMI